MVRRRIAGLGVVITLLANGIIYPAVGIVTKVDYETDMVTVQKATGVEYQFEGVEDLLEGDVMALLMYNNLTPETNADDVVLSARYGGYIADELK